MLHASPGKLENLLENPYPLEGNSNHGGGKTGGGGKKGPASTRRVRKRLGTGLTFF